MNALRKPSYLRAFEEFLYQPAYFFLCAALTVFSNICGMELFTYTCFVLIVLYQCLMGRDLLPILPLAICSYIAPSRGNNPGLSGESVFAFEKGGFYMVILAVLMIIALVLRMIRDRELGRSAFWKCKRTLLPGLAAVAVAYLLSGVGSHQITLVGKQNLLFAFVQAASLFVLYFLMTGMVKWEQAPKSYLAWTGVCVGFVLLAELAFIYLKFDIIHDGIINRDAIYTGWGHYNNMGALLAMMIPFPFFLTTKSKRPVLFYLIGVLFLLGLIFTNSRGSILCGVVIFLASYVFSLFACKQSKKTVLFHIAILLTAFVFLLLFFDQLMRLFTMMLELQFDLRARDTGWDAGWAQFLANPVFGGTFYPNDFNLFTWATSSEFVSFFPPRWHNTIIQILASCGAVGMLAYLYHRFQTLRLLFRRFSWDKMFTLVSMAALLTTSMVDCHFFNVGPVLFYSMMLAFTEKKLDTQQKTVC